jgi:hypothetical protein
MAAVDERNSARERASERDFKSIFADIYGFMEFSLSLSLSVGKLKMTKEVICGEI